jgi:hypothetical protein
MNRALRWLRDFDESLKFRDAPFYLRMIFSENRCTLFRIMR